MTSIKVQIQEHEFIKKKINMMSYLTKKLASLNFENNVFVQIVTKSDSSKLNNKLIVTCNQLLC